MHRERVLKSIVESMTKVMTIPLTVKTRTGVSMGKNIAHNFMPHFRDLGASLITVSSISVFYKYNPWALSRHSLNHGFFFVDVGSWAVKRAKIHSFCRLELH